MKLNTPIKAGQLSPGTDYTFQFEVATFGDANYAKYLNGESINPGECVVNDYMTRTYTIGEPSAILDVYDDAANAAIFDLSGRRVSNTSRPGIYIINGKKVMVK